MTKPSEGSSTSESGTLDLVASYKGLVDRAKRDFSSDPMYATAIARAAMSLTAKKTDT